MFSAKHALTFVVLNKEKLFSHPLHIPQHLFHLFPRHSRTSQLLLNNAERTDKHETKICRFY